ncbi:DTW domain-containing protein [Bowmanella pacifica]|uniref:tRNA-uridine aminocarboxypropyltransferase n=1 Tax=Bowmanella pacifica TaxID=502051 RepID=A0A917YUY2_9ALTE|nr:DTW domain-containing protein [Bowmanella pacifica]
MQKQHNRTKVVILQHPSEVKVAKSTVRLLAMTLNKLDIYVGESAGDFTQVRELCEANPGQVGVLYPSAHSQPLEGQSTPRLQALATLVVLDGTWRKANKIWHCNPWLHTLSGWHFAMPPSSHYQRVAKRPDSLSTLEAVAYGLHTLENLPPEPMLALLHQRQQFLSGQRPD